MSGMSPSSSNLHHQNTAKRRSVPPPLGGANAMARQRSEFEDFMNAYRPTLEVPRREADEKQDSKADFGKSIKKLMKRGQSSPNMQNKNHRKEGVQRTTEDHERSVINELRPAAVSQEKRARRPMSAHVDPSPSTAFILRVTPPLELATSATKIEFQQLSTKNGSKSKADKNGAQELQRTVVDIAPLQPFIPIPAPSSSPVILRKKLSVHELPERLATLPSTPTGRDAHCLVVTRNTIGRFLPPQHNPDPLLSLRVVEVPERKYHVIFEFEETPTVEKPKTSASGLLVVTPEDGIPGDRDQRIAFAWIRESGIANEGLLLVNVERWTEFPYVTYLVVNGSRQDLSQSMTHVRDRPVPLDHPQLHFVDGYEEAVTVCRPSMGPFPELSSSNRSGFVVCLYQVLPGEDGQKFEQNWVMWTGARMLFSHVPDYMGLKRISIHKSVLLPTKIINYALVCEFSYIMDYLTEACVLIDQLRARCCGFTGIYRVLETL